MKVDTAATQRTAGQNAVESQAVTELGLRAEGAYGFARTAVAL